MRMWGTVVALLAAQSFTACARRQHVIARQRGSKALPRLGSQCDGTYTGSSFKAFSQAVTAIKRNVPAIKRQACEDVKVAVYDKSGVGFDKVSPGCYKEDSRLETSWDLWRADSKRANEKLKSHAVGNYNAIMGQKGICAIPRKKSCTDDTQCRPGLLCVPWVNAESLEFRCGTSFDNAILDVDELKNRVSKLQGDMAATTVAKAEKLKELEKVRTQLKADNAEVDDLLKLKAATLADKQKTAPSDAESTKLPAIGEACNGTDHAKVKYATLKSQVCQGVSVPVYRNDMGEVTFETVETRCYKPKTDDTALSWEFWIEDIAEAKSFATRNFYAQSNEVGICAIPREKPCIDNEQCRPGTMCVHWDDTFSPKQFRCGGFQDANSKLAKQGAAASQAFEQMSDKIRGQDVLIRLYNERLPNAEKKEIGW